MKVAFVGGSVRHLAQGDRLFIARDFQDEGGPLMEAFFRLGVVEARASDGHAFNQLGVLYGEGQRPRVRVEGSGDRRRRRRSTRRPVFPVRDVVLRPGIPESDHGVGGVVVDGPLERERAARGRGDERFAQGDRFRILVDGRDLGAGLNGIGCWGPGLAGRL